jgi:hypothetical protein
VEIAHVIKDTVKQKLKSFHEESQHSVNSMPERKLALIIDGRCLMYALDPTLRVDLLGLSLICHSVVCCRVSPLQKAQVNIMSCCSTCLLGKRRTNNLMFLFYFFKPKCTYLKGVECGFHSIYLLIRLLLK